MARGLKHMVYKLRLREMSLISLEKKCSGKPNSNLVIPKRRCQRRRSQAHYRRARQEDETGIRN